MKEKNELKVFILKKSIKVLSLLFFKIMKKSETFT